MKKDKTFEKGNRLFEIWGNFQEKAEYHQRKSNRARKIETINFHYEKAKLYREAVRRCFPLSTVILYPKKFGQVDHSLLEIRYETYFSTVAEKKAKGKQEFESTFRTSLHFMQESFHADYGTFKCNRCQSTFHHSPADMYLGAKKEHEGICGTCVNSILSFNGQELVYN